MLTNNNSLSYRALITQRETAPGVDQYLVLGIRIGEKVRWSISWKAMMGTKESKVCGSELQAVAEETNTHISRAAVACSSSWHDGLLHQGRQQLNNTTKSSVIALKDCNDWRMAAGSL